MKISVADMKSILKEYKLCYTNQDRVFLLNNISKLMGENEDFSDIYLYSVDGLNKIVDIKLIRLIDRFNI